MINSIDDLKPADYNPRRISDDAMSGLKTSLERFGDISGIVWNQRTGNLVSGHQRLESLKQLHGDELKVENNTIITPDGESFIVRVVDWSEELEKEANVSANNPYIAGAFDDSLDDLLNEIKEKHESAFEGLRFDMLETPTFESEAEKSQPSLDKRKPITCPECGHEFTT